MADDNQKADPLIDEHIYSTLAAKSVKATLQREPPQVVAERKRREKMRQAFLRDWKGKSKDEVPRAPGTRFFRDGVLEDYDPTGRGR